MKIFILGPTGVGKTKLSISLAKIYDADVINCDAVQVYKCLDIGSAKVTKDEMDGVVHHLFDIRNPDQEYNVKDYQSDVRNIWDNNKNKNYICVGGTGLYATAAAYDYRFDNDLVTDDFSNKTNEELYEMALKKDNSMNIDKNNRVRLERFLKRSESNVKPSLLYKDAIFIGLTTDRENLYNIINKRVDAMINNGLVDEVKNLYNKYPDSLILKRAIGYKEIINYLNGIYDLDVAISEIKKNSRHYAKRQYTWFNNKMNIKWFDVNFDNFDLTIEMVKEYIDTCK